LPVYEVYNLQVFVYKIVHDDARHPIFLHCLKKPLNKLIEIK